MDHIRPGFDYWFSFVGQGKYIDPPVNDNGFEYKEKGYITDILTEKPLIGLKKKRDPNKPFSLNLWHKAVHEPHIPAQRHNDLYDNVELPTPPHTIPIKKHLKTNHYGKKKLLGLNGKKTYLFLMNCLKKSGL